MSHLHKQRLAQEALENMPPADEHAHMDFPPGRDEKQRAVTDMSDTELLAEIARRQEANGEHEKAEAGLLAKLRNMLLGGVNVGQ